MARDVLQHFYFGCEADDRTTLWAFDPRMGFRLRPVFSSDFTDFADVIPEAFGIRPVLDLLAKRS